MYLSTIHFIAGVAGGMACTLVEHPFDTVKVLLQADKQNVYRSSAWRCTYLVTKTHGVAGLYAGLSARLWISGIEHALLFTVYHSLLQWFHGRRSSLVEAPQWCDVLLAGGLTGVCSGLCLIPFELLKCQMQGGTNTPSDTGSSLSSAVPRRTFFSHRPSPVLTSCTCATSSSASILRDVYSHQPRYPFAGVQQLEGTAAWSSIRITPSSSTTSLLSTSMRTPLSPFVRRRLRWRCFAGFSTAIQCFRVSVLLSRWWRIFRRHRSPCAATPYSTWNRPSHCSSPPLSLRHVASDIFRQKGIRGLFRGGVGTMLREIPGTAVWLGGYEMMRHLFETQNQRKGNTTVSETSCSSTTSSSTSSLSPWQTIFSGGVSGVLFWTICFPADVVKTRQQVETTSSVHMNKRTHVEEHGEKRKACRTRKRNATRAERVAVTRRIRNLSTVSSVSSSYASYNGNGIPQCFPCYVRPEKFAPESSFLGTLMDVYREGGVRKLYSGWAITVMRSFPSNAVLFYTYEEVKHLLEHFSPPPSTPSESALCYAPI